VVMDDGADHRPPGERAGGGDVGPRHAGQPPEPPRGRCHGRQGEQGGDDQVLVAVVPTLSDGGGRQCADEEEDRGAGSSTTAVTARCLTGTLRAHEFHRVDQRARPLSPSWFCPLTPWNMHNPPNSPLPPPVWTVGAW